MEVAGRAGLTLLEVVFLVFILALFLAACPCDFQASIDVARTTAMKNKARGIWIAIMSTQMDGEWGNDGPPKVWPKDLGFDANHTSTEYFRRLMADEHGGVATSNAHQLVPDLSPSLLAGMGVPVAATPASFSSTNNAWQVLVVGDNTPSATAFLVTRNADLGRRVTSNSVVSVTRAMPVGRKRVIWCTRGGSLHDAHPKYFHAAILIPSNNATYDVMMP